MIAGLALSWGTAGAGELPLIPRGDVWSYLDTGVDPGAGWQLPDFDDGGWATGTAPLGYGLANLGTTVSYGPNPAARYPTTWFRQSFVVPNPAAFEALSLHLRRDDGAAVWVNGVEVLRTNLAANATSASYATTGVYGDEQDRYVPVVLPPGVVVQGRNVVAVEVHNQSASSADLVMDLGLSGWDGPTAVVRGPWLQQPTPDGLVVRWTTDGPGAGVLSWGPQPNDLSHQRTDPAVAFDHELRIDGWPADTDVAYAVGHPTAGVLAGADVDHVAHTPPRRGARTPLRFWVLGDSGTANADAEAVRDAYLSAHPDPLDTDVWLMLGDNAYGSGTAAEYDEAVFAFYPELLRQVPLWAALGNHDGYSSFSDTQTGPYFDLFSWPSAGEVGGEPSGTEAYWSFDHGNVHVIVLDSYHSDRSATGPMATWLRADLAATGADWVIAAFHHPPYSKGSHDSDDEAELVEMRENLLPILEDFGVDLVLSGHSHSYERSFLVDGHYGDSTELLPSMLLQDHDGDPNGDGAYRKWPTEPTPHQGTVAVVAGSSGQASAGTLDHPVMHVSMSVLGSLVLEVRGLELEATFLDDLGVEQDRFALLKGVTTLTEVDGGTLAFQNEPLAFHALAVQPDGDEVPTYRWDWGDGTADATTADAVHAWTSEGRFTATVTATDDQGGSVSDSLTVNIDNGAPVIDDLFASPAVEGSPVTLTVVASDPGNDPLTATWVVDNGDEREGDVVTTTFWDDGSWLATVTVTDDAGRRVDGELAIEVENAPPELVALDDGSPVEGSPATLRVTFDDPGFDPVTVTWDFGDGAPVTGPTVTRTFVSSGPQPLTLTLRDDAGATTVEELTIDVANAEPTLGEVTVDGEPVEGGVLRFSATAADAGIEDELVVTWDFGDGSQRVVGDEVAHVFPDQGPWEVLTTVEDGDGGLGYILTPLSLTNRPPRVDTVFAPSATVEGRSETFRVLAEDPGAGDALLVTWSFGDGSSADGAEVRHAWADEGTYTVGLSVVDDEGEGESSLFEVGVVNAAPVFRSDPGRLLVEPGAGFRYEVVVEDTDPVDLTLRSPGGATLADGVVTWTAPETVGASAAFELVADDHDGGVTTQAFVLVVAEGSAAPDDRLESGGPVACGCRSTGGPGLGSLLWLVVLRQVRRGQVPPLRTTTSASSSDTSAARAVQNSARSGPRKSAN